MARMPKWLALAALALSLTGCVSEEKYTAMKLRADQLASQAAQSEADAQSARAQADAYKGQIDQFGNSTNVSGALVTNLQKQNSDLQSQLATLQTKYEDLASKGPQVVTVGGNALPAQLSNALSALADQNPDIMTFDAARGIVKFKSDVTFSSGSTDLSAKAKDAIQRFASILNTAGAGGYELMIAGHTDNQKVTRQSTINEGNFDNWYLSSHRAISVGAALVQDGVNRDRLGVVGYADTRPIASNATEAGRAQNRRVEILILPTAASAAPRGVASASNGGAITASHRTAPEAKRLDKDSADSDRTSITK